MSSQPPTESDPRDGESADEKTTRFKALAKGLFGVSREEFAAQEKVHEAKRSSAKNSD
jgi:hypothetical protein